MRWYQFDAAGRTPALVQQGTIHPGPGVNTFNGSIAQDADGNLGMTYMQSSAHEYVSMYVATKPVGTLLGVMGNGIAAAPGLGLMTLADRAGDYSSVAVDPTDGKIFWAANEYIRGGRGHRRLADPHCLVPGGGRSRRELLHVKRQRRRAPEHRGHGARQRGQEVEGVLVLATCPH